MRFINYYECPSCRNTWEDRSSVQGSPDNCPACQMQVEPHSVEDMLLLLQVWDNKGETIDRYTVVWPDGTYVAMSADPFHPQGVGQYGEGCEYFDVQPWKCRLGTAREFDELPEECQKLILQELHHTGD